MATPNPKATLQSRFGFQDPDLTNPVHDDIQLWLVSHTEQAIQSLGPRVADLKKINLGFLQGARKELFSRQASREQRLAGAKRDVNKEVEYQALHPQSDLLPAGRLSAGQLDAGRTAAARLARYRQDVDTAAGELETARRHLLACDTLIASLPVAQMWPVPYRIAQKRSEHLILNGHFPIGFVDLFADAVVEEPYLEDCDRWLASWCDKSTPDATPRLPELCAVNLHAHFYFEIKPKIQAFGELIRQLRLYQEFISHPEGGPRHSIAGIPPRIGVVSPDHRFATAIRDEGFFFLPIQATPTGGWEICDGG